MEKSATPNPQIFPHFNRLQQQRDLFLTIINKIVIEFYIQLSILPIKFFFIFVLLPFYNNYY
jgi:hypothetical protein